MTKQQYVRWTTDTPGGVSWEVRGLSNWFPRFGLFVGGERFRVFWGWTSSHATIRAITYARELGA